MGEGEVSGGCCGGSGNFGGMGGDAGGDGMMYS